MKISSIYTITILVKEDRIKKDKEERDGSGYFIVQQNKTCYQ